MSQCMTCRYALYDGMCLAKGKFTTLDAPACDTYVERTDVEASRLKAENAKLRELTRDMYGVMWACAEQRCTHRDEGCFRVRGNHSDDICASGRCWYEDRMSELGIEV